MEVSDKSHVAQQTDPWSWHIRETLLLGAPLIAAQFAQMGLNVTNTIVLGTLGPDELAASVIGWSLYFLIWMLGSGFGFALMPLVASANGAEDAYSGGKYLCSALCLVLAYSLLMLIPLSYAESIYLLLGQSAKTASLAAEYISTLKWSLFSQLAIIALRSFLVASGRPNAPVVALIAGVSLNLVLSNLLVHGGFGLPPMGMAGAGLSTFISTSFIALLLVCYIVFRDELSNRKDLSNIFRIEVKPILDVFHLGWPIGITIVAEMALFMAASFMIGTISTIQLAAHGVALQLEALAFMIPLGLSSATTVRVGRAMGASRFADLKRALAASFLIGAFIAFLLVALFFSIPLTLIGFYLKDTSEAATAAAIFAVPLLKIVAILILLDTIQALITGALRGMKESRVPMVIALVSYWLIGIPSSYVLGLKFGWDAFGVWVGLVVGMTVASALMAARLMHKLAQLKRT